ncbi:hypothetical protein H2248_010814 [Termitomyces sp. 'cryptogamus']|nr:hypothetical protein H2248_010814 [Termitomyces sp. 'cryptogamus']
MPVVSRTRLFPTSPQKLTHTPLSILDAAVVRYSPSAGVWIFKDAPSVDHLSVSLNITLDAYPQWSGQLQWTPYNPNGDHTQRLQRLMLSYGSPDDPGVEFIIATSSRSISSFVGNPVDGCINASNLPFVELIGSTPSLALHDAATYAGLPSLIIQITTLADGGVAIGLKFAHPIADAHSMLQFTSDWAAVSRALRKREPLPMLSPVFDPSLIDRAAAGDIDALSPLPSILEIARDLPLHRYDCWNSKIDCPPFLESLTTVPPEVESIVSHFGQPIEWKNWDYKAPVSYYLVEFSPGELYAMWEEANLTSRVSHLDALLAHIWNLIIRARRLDGEYHLDVSFGFRNRLNPPLPTSFLGSPISSLQVTSTAQDAVDHNLGSTAACIRSALSAFDASTIPALLHELAFEVSPLRTWGAFFGSRNTIITSWLGKQPRCMRDMDFGTGPPTVVEAVMPGIDGCVQVMEANPRDLEEKSWYESGAIISLYLRDDVMENILRDPALRKYRHDKS